MSKPLDFGDLCWIEQKRYGAPNEMYVHKVIGRLESNSWVEVPVDAAKHGTTQQRHDKMAPVIAAICCGVQELEVRYYRETDCRPAPTGNG